ncbi:hypothetical protein GWI33_009785 [Rhynchophorus ferrugineus]|uniref:Uncharacterized protein n=1 Tax=Rhynchophorus ferrugineus TaxID=354439 RepID=A0A834MJV1_RHYFE|nr:hypothetical protein GWI33_009785 [Rhynchophorus ferrugineus]
MGSGDVVEPNHTEHHQGGRAFLKFLSPFTMAFKYKENISYGIRRLIVCKKDRVITTGKGMDVSYMEIGKLLETKSPKLMSGN